MAYPSINKPVFLTVNKIIYKTCNKPWLCASRLALKLVFLVGVVFLNPQNAEAQINVANDYPKVYIGVAGKPLVIPLLLKNTGSSKVELQAVLELPENWQGGNNKAITHLSVGDSLLRLVTISIPRQATMGSYTINFTLVDHKNEVAYRGLFSVRVLGITGLQLVASQTTMYANVGEHFTNSYSLFNNGNQPAKVFIRASGGEINGPIIIDIEAFGVYHFELSGRPVLPYGSRNRSLNVWVRAGYVADGIDIVSTHSSIMLTGIRSDYSVNGKFHTFPITAGVTNYFRVIGNDVKKGLQGEVFGAGYIDMNQKKKLDFTFRGPDQFDMTLPGSYDEYRVGYSSGSFSFVVGDYNYNLSPLTEASRNGRGLRGEFLKGNVSAFAFFHRPRFLPGIESIAGSKVSVGFGRLNKISANLLYKNNSELPGSSVFSIEPSLRISENTHLNFEVATGVHNGKTGFAGHVDFRTVLNNLSASGYLVLSDNLFPGYTTGTFSWMGSLNYRLGKRSNLFFNANTSDRNRLLDTLWIKMPYMESYRIGTNIDFGNIGRISLYAGCTSSEDRNENKLFHHNMRYLRLNYWFRARFFTFDARADYRNTENLTLNIGARQVDGFGVFSRLNFHIFRFMSIGLFGSLDRDNRYSQETRNLVLYGANLNVNLKGKFNAMVSYQNNQYLEDYYMQRSQLNLNISARILNRHKIGLKIRYSDGKAANYQSIFAAGVSYSLSFNAPLKRLPVATGAVYGAIHRAGGALPGNVTILLDRHSTQTDENGQFSFTNLPPGTYYLSVDPTTVAFREIPNLPMPLVVNVSGGEETQIIINFVFAGNVSGTLGFLCNGNANGLETGNGMNSTNLNGNGVVGLTGLLSREEFFKKFRFIIELQRGAEKIRRLVHLDGTYSILGLRPGKYTAKISGIGLPGIYEIDRPEFQFELSEGGTVYFSPCINNRSRNIRMVEPPSNYRKK